MAGREYSKYQQKVIRNYYDNQEQIDEQRLSELVTNLFLSEGKKLAKHWETAEGIMGRYDIPESRVKHIMDSADAAILAELVKDIQAGRIKRKTKKQDK